MTLKQAAQAALDCQVACNLSGVLATLNEIVQTVLWPEARRLGKGTEYVNQHPIVALFLAKLVDLNGQQAIWSGQDSAHDQVKAIAEGATELSAEHLANAVNNYAEFSNDELERVAKAGNSIAAEVLTARKKAHPATEREPDFSDFSKDFET